MTIPFFANRTTLHRLHQTVQRNIVRNHQARYESSNSTRNASTTTTSGLSSPLPPTRTIPTQNSWIDPFLRPFRAYGRMQHRSPLMTQFESTLVIYYLGDLVSQTIGTNVFIDGEYEPIRGLRMMLIGALSSIPGYKWFIFLGNHFNYRSHLLSLATKVVVNQTFFTPVFNTYFFGMQTLLSGGSWADAKERVWNTVPVSWVNSWKVWPVVTAINFSFVPWQYRNVFAGVIAIGWQGYLSWLNKREEKREGAVQEREKLEREREMARLRARDGGGLRRRESGVELLERRRRVKSGGEEGNG